MLGFKYILGPVVSGLNINLNEFINQWCIDMDSITHHDRRKLSGLVHMEYLSSGSIDVNKLFAPIVCAALEILSDLGTRKSEGKTEDNLVLTKGGRKELLEKNSPSEPAELWVDIRRRKSQIDSMAYNVNLIETINAVLQPYMSTPLYSAIDEKVRNQLTDLLQGQTIGWGTADKDHLFQ